MAYNEALAQRVRQGLSSCPKAVIEKKMMGGLTFMVDDKMCIGIMKDNLMCRVDPEIYESVVNRKGARPMDFTGKPMIGYIFVSKEGIQSDKDFQYWINLCLDFNDRAKASRKRKVK